MYLKVDGNLSQPSLNEVQDAVNEIAPNAGLKVDEDLYYPCVEFPDGASYDEFVRVRTALNERGFEAY